MKLLLLGLKVNVLEVIEFVRVLRRSLPNIRFILAYLLLKLSYFFDSPYQVSKRYLLLKGAEDLYVYGETPITLLQAVMKEAEIERGEHVFELGSGAGFTSLWLALIAGHKVTAIEQIPAFVRRLKRISGLFRIKRLNVLEGDYLQEDLSTATVVYLYALDLSDDDLKELVDKLQTLPAGSRVISVSFPVQDYCAESGKFEAVKQFTATFPWGETDVYLSKTSGGLKSDDQQSYRYSERPAPVPAVEETDKSPT